MAAEEEEGEEEGTVNGDSRGTGADGFPAFRAVLAEPIVSECGASLPTARSTRLSALYAPS